MNLQKRRLDPINQLPIVKLHANRDAIIEGTYGTGKTTIAIHRANYLFNALKKDGNAPKVAIFMYNRVLYQYIIQFLKISAIENIQIHTYYSWLKTFYKKTFGEQLPEIRKFYPIWPKIIGKMENLPVIFNHILIDEAQLLPQEMIYIFSIITNNLTIFFNESDVSNVECNKAEVINRTRREFDIYYLERNFRNCMSISKLIDNIQFLKRMEQKCKIVKLLKIYNKKISDKLAKFSFRRGVQKNSDSFDYSAVKLFKLKDFDHVILFIKELAYKTKHNVGILLPPNLNLVEKYFTSLNTGLNDISVQRYNSNRRHFTEFGFEEVGIKILTYISAYGIEFETVVMPALDDNYFNSLLTSKIAYFNLSCTRAKKELFFLYTNENNKSKIIDILNEISHGVKD